MSLLHREREVEFTLEILGLFVRSPFVCEPSGSESGEYDAGGDGRRHRLWQRGGKRAPDAVGHLNGASERAQHFCVFDPDLQKEFAARSAAFHVLTQTAALIRQEHAKGERLDLGAESDAVHAQDLREERALWIRVGRRKFCGILERLQFGLAA